ncbi:MAG TPA: hypothetical protein VNF73_15330 [Candidatus Saccharimonadales bacterium]|nr:hypothetical protein [Candidatus Saccharimonadales bacterium]
MPPDPARRVPVHRGLPRPLQLVLWATFAAVVGTVVGLTAPTALHAIGVTAALAPAKLAWYAVRGTGFVAYLAVAGSVVYGLMLSTKLLDAIAHRPISFALHKDLALVGLALSGLHGGLLLGDQTFSFTAFAILVPFASPYAPVAVGVGQVAFYVVGIVTGSFYVRRSIGQRAWRQIHYLTFLGFVGVAAHGIAAGSDTATTWAVWLYAIPVAMVVFLFVYRLVTAVGAATIRRTSGAPGVRSGAIGPARQPPMASHGRAPAAEVPAE